MGTRASRSLPEDEFNAAINATAPSAANPFVTMSALPAGDNIGSSDLAVDLADASRYLTLSGNTFGEDFTIRNLALTPVVSFHGNNQINIPTGQVAIGAAFANGVELSVNTVNQYPAIQVYHAGYNGMAHLITIASTGGSHAQGYVCNSSNVVAIHKTGFRVDISGSTVTNTAIEIVNGDIEFSTTGVGSKVGETNLDLFAFWGATPIVQPTNAIVASAFAANTSGITDDTATYGGYTGGQIVAALQAEGLLA